MCCSDQSSKDTNNHHVVQTSDLHIPKLVVCIHSVIILFNLSTTLDSPDQLSPLRLSCFSFNLTSCTSSIYFADSSSFSPSLNMGVHLNFIFSIPSTVFPGNIIQSYVFTYRHTGDFQICIFSLDLTSGLQTLFCSLLYPHNIE